MGAIWLVGTRENIEVYQCFIKVQSTTTQFSLNTNKYSRPHQHSINQISTIGQILGFFSTESQLREHRCNSLWCFRLAQHQEIMDWILMLIKNRDSIGALHNLDIQSWEKVFVCGLVQFVPAVAYQFWLNLSWYSNCLCAQGWHSSPVHITICLPWHLFTCYPADNKSPNLSSINIWSMSFQYQFILNVLSIPTK